MGLRTKAEYCRNDALGCVKGTAEKIHPLD